MTSDLGVLVGGVRVPLCQGESPRRNLLLPRAVCCECQDEVRGYSKAWTDRGVQVGKA